MIAIDRTQLAIGVGPFVPDGDAMLLQPMDIGFAAQEPEQFIDDGFQMHLLGGDQRKTLGQIEAHLVAEDGAGAGAGAVALFHARFEGQSHQIEILPHGEILADSRLHRTGSGLSDPVPAMPARLHRHQPVARPIFQQPVGVGETFAVIKALTMPVHRHIGGIVDSTPRAARSDAWVMVS